jgi:type IV pilus assembly protein PilB
MPDFVPRIWTTPGSRTGQSVAVACNNGYKGRVGIYQVMPISDEIQRIILRDGNAMEIADQARREGVKTLREAGLQKVKMGLTSLDEVLAVTNE